MDRKALSAAFPVTVPVLMGYLAIGIAFGLMLQEIGYNFIWAFFMSLTIYAGSGQYLGVTLLGAAASAAGMLIAAMAAASTFIPVLGVDPDAAFRILLLSTTVLDSLPFAGAIVAMMSITGIKYKEGYPPIAMTTVLFTFLGNMIVAVLYSVFPMLP